MKQAKPIQDRKDRPKGAFDQRERLRLSVQDDRVLPKGDQLGFDALLHDADHDNKTRIFEREAAHLPSAYPEAIAYHRQQISDHHAAMLACDFETALGIREDAHLLAQRLNGGEPGILAHDDAPGYLLVRECGVESGSIPLWGQDGHFRLYVGDMAAEITMHGMFCIGATAMTYLSFEAHAVDRSKPFLSDTGYRSFLGCSLAAEAGLTVEAFVTRVFTHYIETDLRGKLVAVGEQFR